MRGMEGGEREGERIRGRYGKREGGTVRGMDKWCKMDEEDRSE